MNSRARYIFLVSLLLRLCAIPLSIVRVNPYAQGDAIGFEKSASNTASQIISHSIPSIDIFQIYQVWGGILSPFWFIPGPSDIYARIILAILGAGAVYNIYIIGEKIHSEQAGLLASLPLMLFPSIVLVHSTLLREGAVLFTMTTAVRLLIAPGQRLSDIDRAILIFAVLIFSALLRWENVVIFIISGMAGVFLTAYIKFGKPSIIPQILVVAGSIFTILLWDKLQKLLIYLTQLRMNRARGRTAYLINLFPESILSAIGFSWIGVIHFYFTPFIWMVSTPADAIVFAEAIINLIAGVAAIFGLRVFITRYPIRATTLLTGFLVASLVYGYATANVGTAVRHRQMFIWVIYLLAGIGIANKFQFKLPQLNPQEQDGKTGRKYPSK